MSMTSPSLPSTDAPPIRVTLHALKRARERHGDLRGHGERALERIIRQEVLGALGSGRFAKTVPREALTDERYTKRGKGTTERYLWNSTRSRVYVMRRVAGVAIIITVLDTVNSIP